MLKKIKQSKSEKVLLIFTKIVHLTKITMSYGNCVIVKDYNLHTC